MSGDIFEKKYNSIKIPGREQLEAQREAARTEAGRRQSAGEAPRQEDLFYEIEYDSAPFPGRSAPIPGVGKFVLKPQKVEPPVRDEVRERFNQMRDITRRYRLNFHSGRFYDRQVQRENARVLYEQAMFMQDFEDHFDRVVPYSSYYPNYQMMGYEQLRTYFTWRTQVRRGEITETSLSYVFLYIYELLDNIGVAGPEEGLERLLGIWRALQGYDSTLDKYVVKWLKDYHIYYEMPWSFSEFVEREGLGPYYPDVVEDEDPFELYCGISRYDIRKSKFFSAEKEALIRDCFAHTMERLRQIFREQGIPFEDSIFQPRKNMAHWEPFRGALFCPWKPQRDRKVMLSQKEIYVCTHNNWTYSSVIISESGRKLIGYVMKQLEVVLRGLTKYKYKLSADVGTVTHEAVQMLAAKGLSLERIVTEAVTDCYREATKTVVKVDPTSLLRIRQEAYQTQEALTVPEAAEELSVMVWPAEENEVFTQMSFPRQAEMEMSAALPVNHVTSFDREPAAAGPDGPWEELRSLLSGTELQALALLAGVGTNGRQQGDIRQFADEHGVMLEVLLDGINEKAMDTVGDSLTDDELMIYDDYIEEVREMVERL